LSGKEGRSQCPISSFFFKKIYLYAILFMHLAINYTKVQQQNLSQVRGEY
jgi:hypothetical protein